jgi:hypothetical protein
MFKVSGRNYLMGGIAAGLISLGAWAAIAAPLAESPSSPTSPLTFSCALTPQNDSSIWNANVTVTGPTPDISGGDAIRMLTVGFYDSSGREIGTNSAFGTISGIPAGQSLTYDDYTSYSGGSGVTPQTCQVESDF